VNEIANKVQVFVTPHALRRIGERGGDPALIAAAARRAARRATPCQRLALDIACAPEVVPIVELRPRRGGLHAVVIAVLPGIPLDRPVFSVDE